jgi:hypothetical protein
MARVAISVSRCRGAVLAGLVLVLAAGCGASAPAGLTAVVAPARVTISETGSTLLFPLVGTWADAFHRKHPDIVITSAATGSGAGAGGGRHRGRAGDGGRERLGPGPPARGVPLTAGPRARRTRPR